MFEKLVIIICVLLTIYALYLIKQSIANKRYKKSLRWWSSDCGRLEIEMPIDWAEKAWFAGSKDAGMNSCYEEILIISQKESIIDYTSAWNRNILSEVLSKRGTWAVLDLEDHKQNIQRMLWIICCELHEQEEEIRDYSL